MTNLKNVGSNFFKKEKKSYKNIDIYYIGYMKIKKIDDYENIYSVNPLHLIINTADGHIEEKTGSKYLTFASTDKNKEVLKIHKTLA